MSKLSFRARALDASKPMPIYMAEELPDLPDYSAINRAVPQMPSGMQKEEECEHHLQRAIVAGLIIPTPEVSEMPNKEFYERVYPANYKQPRQLIHMQPFTMEQDIIDYDMDSEDERWLQQQSNKLDLSAEKFEEMMDRLEKSSGQTVVTLNEAKALLKEDDDLIIAVFDYWLNKRLKTQHPLILTVKTEQRAGAAPNNPYLAFRRRTEKMQTRKNRKNDEASYEKMLKLRRDLCRAVTLLELVKRREKIKREYVHLTIEVFEKRYHAKDFSGAILAEASAVKTSSRPAFTPIFHNHYTNQSWSNKAILKDEIIPRREKRQYKKRKHKSLTSGGRSGTLDPLGGGLSSDEDTTSQTQPSPVDSVEESSQQSLTEDEGRYAFRRNKLCQYHMPLPSEGNWPWCSKEEHGLADRRYRFALTSLSHPARRCVGFARRRVGRGGRVILDRVATDYDDLWRTLDFSIVEPQRNQQQVKLEVSGRDDAASVSTCGVSGSNSFSTSISETRTSSSVMADNSGVFGSAVGDVRVKQEPTSTPDEDVKPTTSPLIVDDTTQHQEDMVEVLRSIRRDWLHFRPKTPPADWEPPCDMLLMEDTFFSPLSGAPFSMEVQPLEGGESFVTEPVSFANCLSPDSSDTEPPALEVPVTDTRQQPEETGGRGEDEWWCSGASGDGRGNDDDDDDAGDIVGCSRFTVTGGRRNSSTLTSPKRSGSGNGSIGSGGTIKTEDEGGGGGNGGEGGGGSGSSGGGEKSNSSRPQDGTGTTHGSNGLLTQFGLDVPSNRTKNNKLYAYSSAVGYPNASPSTLSFHTSAHTLTLNSHSANIFDIPIANDSTEAGSKLETDPPVGNTVSANNKAKTIVRKNNFVMEVT
ncbi:unnamed protein product [Callosobruchus maculatus]|uniref:Enhancer of polycomb-like protein n=1 Tax=Callosobruchus maculatus TaxID=64391 RepID=A0A653CV74_CALMS|nr:unnamed protein product [Callosobruchus maculatus]